MGIHAALAVHPASGHGAAARIADTVAERLRAAVEASPLIIDNSSIAMTVSIGIAASRLSQPNFDALMKAADQALYRCKARGRNQIAIAMPEQSTDLKSAAE